MEEKGTYMYIKEGIIISWVHGCSVVCVTSRVIHRWGKIYTFIYFAADTYLAGFVTHRSLACENLVIEHCCCP